MPSLKSNISSLIAWSLYDVATSAFSVIIQTFVFATYFVNHVASDKNQGVFQWGMAMAIAGFVVAVGGPILGAIADQDKQRKTRIAFWTMVAVLAIACMWFVRPSPSYALLGMFLITLSTVAVEFAYIFYNAMLPDLAGAHNIGRWSGWGWGSGYVGGIISLTLALILFIEPSIIVPSVDFVDIRATCLLVAVWYVIFSIPLFIWTPQDAAEPRIPLKNKVVAALQQVVQSFKQISSHKQVFYFLVARMLYIDALITLFAFGGIYAAATFQLTEEQILFFGISLNITAGIGAGLFGWLDDKFGGKSMIIASLCGLLIAATLALMMQELAWFWGLALCAGVFVGPIQASSRSFLARVAPVNLRNQMFGLFALSAKATSFLGPLAVGWVTYWTDSLRLGMATILIFLLSGLLLMLRVVNDK